MWGAYLFFSISTAYILWVLWVLRPDGPESTRTIQVPVIPVIKAEEPVVYADKDFLQLLREMR